MLFKKLRIPFKDEQEHLEAAMLTTPNGFWDNGQVNSWGVWRWYSEHRDYLGGNVRCQSKQASVAFGVLCWRFHWKSLMRDPS